MFSTSGGQSADGMPSSFSPNADLMDKVNNLWDNALSANTRLAYRTGLQCLLTFLTMSGAT